MSPTNNAQESPDNTSLRELRDEVKDLNKSLKKAIKSTDKFSLAFMILAFVQIIIGFFQFVKDSLNNDANKWVGVFWVVLLALIIYFFIKSGFNEDKD